ncbi:hypothetical protein [Streptomyces sp. NPDC002851]
MSTPETSRYVRMRVELVLDVTDSAALTGAALDLIAADDALPDEERGHAADAVRDDAAEALAYLVDPVDLVADVPGVELTQASWSSEPADGGLADEDDAWDEDEDQDEDQGADPADPDDVWEEDGSYQPLSSGA